MKNDFLDLNDGLVLLKKYRPSVFLITSISLAVFALAAILAPKKFKSRAVFSIYNSYFQTPLVKDFTSEVYDTSELRAMRESIIKQALNDEFVDALVVQFFDSNSPLSLTQKRDEIYSRLETLPLNATTSHIGFIGRTPEQSFQFSRAMLEQIKKTFVEQRQKNLERIRDGIRQRLETMSLDTQGTSNPLASNRPDMIQLELTRLDAEISSLLGQYTQEHPRVKNLIAKRKIFQRWIEESSISGKLESSNTETSEKPFLSLGNSNFSRPVYEELLHKYHLISIAIDIEDPNTVPYFAIAEQPIKSEAPIWPNKKLFVVWGFLCGIFISALWILLREILRGYSSSPLKYAQSAGIPYLGNLPKIQSAPATPESSPTLAEASHESNSSI